MPRKKTIAVLLSFFAALVFVHAQVVPSVKYTSKDGLGSDRITAIAQDGNGRMWLGSFFGISKYDGIRFERVALPPQQQNKYVNFLVAAGKKIYAGFLFHGGLAELDEEKARSYFIGGRDSLASNEFVCAQAEEDGSLFLMNTANQLFRFRNGHFQYLNTLSPLRQGSFARSIKKDKIGNLWIATEAGLFILPPPYTTAHIYHANENVFSLSADSAGRMLFTRTDGAHSFISRCDGWGLNGVMDEKVLYATGSVKQAGFGANSRTGIALIDPMAGLVRSDNGGACTLHAIPVDYTTDISALFCDRENNIWIANEPGILKLSNFYNRSYEFQELAAGGGAFVSLNDSLRLVCNSKSLYLLSDKSLKKVGLEKKPRDYYGSMYVDKKGNAWIGLWNDGVWLTRWRGEKLVGKKFMYEFKGQKIKAQAMIEDSQGNLWLGGLNGLFRCRNGEIIDSFHPLNAVGNPAFISCMWLDEKNCTLWLGDNASGIIKLHYEFGEASRIRYTTESYISAKEGLKDTYVRSLLVDHRRTLWVGTRYGGIFRIHEEGKGFRVVNCNAEAKMSCTRVTNITPEDTSAVWFASCDGLYAYRFKTGEWKHLSTADGLLNAEIFTVSIPNGKELFALSAQGITRSLLQQQANTVAPLVTISSVRVLGEKDTDALRSEGPSSYSYRRNSIEFDFYGASFIDEKKIRYTYMLEGYDQKWSEPVTGNSVSYASLSPGKYVFRVLASNARGHWSEKAASFAFEITMPLYRRSWFIFLLAITSLVAFYFLRTQRLRQRYRIEKLRLAIARDLHDDIGSTLGSINILSKTAARKMDKTLQPAEIAPIFTRIGQKAENTLDAMDDIVWAINPEKDNAEDLFIRMREFAIPLLEARNIAFDFSSSGTLRQSIPMNLRRNAFLIFKEAVHNCLKHADAKKIRIDLHIVSGFLTIAVQDDGKGFDATLPKARNGLRNMQQRAALAGGHLDIFSSEEGTRMVLRAPLR